MQRDGFRESIIRLGVKIDNGLEKLNQGLKKAEKVKNSDQTSGSNLQTSVRATRSQRREARVRLVHSRTRLAFLRKIMAATSFVDTSVVHTSIFFCLCRIHTYIFEKNVVCATYRRLYVPRVTYIHLYVGKCMWENVCM